jgi:hypothetical protein
MNSEKFVRPDLEEDYEEPILLGAEDLENVAGGCIAGCSDGSCSKPNLTSSGIES